jgi:hypothetical protein
MDNAGRAMAATGLSSFAVVMELLKRLSETGLVSDQMAIDIMDGALASVESWDAGSENEEMRDVFRRARDLLGRQLEGLRKQKP